MVAQLSSINRRPARVLFRAMALASSLFPVPDGPPTATWADIDWSRTRAYATGPGHIFVNVEPREPGGVVDPDGERDRVLSEIATGCTGPVVPDTIRGESGSLPSTSTKKPSPAITKDCGRPAIASIVPGWAKTPTC